MPWQWTFLSDGQSKGVPISPFLDVPAVVIKDKNEEVRECEFQTSKTVIDEDVQVAFSRDATIHHPHRETLFEHESDDLFIFRCDYYTRVAWDCFSSKTQRKEGIG